MKSETNFCPRCGKPVWRSPADAIHTCSPPDKTRESSHWEGCWATRGHHECAITHVDRLERELAECKRDAKHWQALHWKTGRIYTVVGEAIDATNATQGRVMVIYERDGRRFVRDAYEFQEKFAAIDAAREKT